MKGIVSNEGNEVSNCMSNSDAWGKMVDNCPRMGETASPGKALKADMEASPQKYSAWFRIIIGRYFDFVSR